MADEYIVESEVDSRGRTRYRIRKDNSGCIKGPWALFVGVAIFELFYITTHRSSIHDWPDAEKGVIAFLLILVLPVILWKLLVRDFAGLLQGLWGISLFSVLGIMIYAYFTRQASPHEWQQTELGATLALCVLFIPIILIRLFHRTRRTRSR